MPERIFQNTMRRTVTPADLSPVNVYTADITLDGGHGTVVVDTTAGDVTVTLPLAAQAPGRQYVIHKKVAANTLKVLATSPDQINYAALPGFLMTAQDEEATMLSAGAEDTWLVCPCAGTLVPSVVAGALITRVPTASTFNIGSSTQYVMMGTSSTAVSGQGTIGDAQMRCPRDMTITAIYVRLASALSSGETLDCQANVAGSADAGITVSHTDATGTLTSDTGTVTVAQDQLLCYEFTFGGGLSSTSLNSITMAYTVAPE